MRPVFQLTRKTRAWSLWARYLATAGLVLFALGVGLGFENWHEGYPLILFYPAIILSALAFDRGASLFATGLSAVFLAYFFLPPEGFAVGAEKDAVALLVFVGVGSVLGMAIESAHTYLAELEVAKRAAERATEEREILLKEVAHRVQNNLQLLASMLSVERQMSRHADPQRLLASIVERVKTMARLHAALFQRGAAGTVDASQFLEQFCADIRTGVIAGEPIAFRCRAIRTEIRLDRAVTIGLIINELVTNAVKYAFKDRQSGEIDVSFSREGGQYLLSVTDNGNGMGDLKADGFGQHLIRVLAAQLGGKVAVQSAPGQGARFTVTFAATDSL